MVIGLRDGQIEARRFTSASLKYAVKRFPATAKGANSCARHIVRVLRRNPQGLSFSSDAEHPEECGFEKGFDLDALLAPHLKVER